MVYISPSILSADFANLQRDCTEAVGNGADFLHIDVMDGHFVPNITIGAPVLKCLKKAIPDAFYDVHLMISDPNRYAPQFAEAGADLICFHLESDGDVQQTIDTIRSLGCKVGIAVKPATPVDAVLPFIDKVDLVLVMTVEPGFGGQDFMTEQCEKVFALRQATIDRGLDSLMIEVDGGIDKYTSQIAVTAGANVLVAGSAVFGRGSIAQNIAAIRRACQGEG